MDASGNLYVADQFNFAVRKITPQGVVTTLAGSPATSDFWFPVGIAVDADGYVYVAENYYNSIRKISPQGVITTLAGNRGATSIGSADGVGAAAQFNNPFGVALDGSGNLYVADTNNCTIRKITPDGTVTTLAGMAGSPGTADGNGADARFLYPLGIAVDGSGSLFVTDTSASTVRKITPDGTVSTIGGSPTVATDRDGVGSAARFSLPTGIAAGFDGKLYVADAANNRISVGTVLTSPTPVINVQQATGIGLSSGTGAASFGSVTLGSSTQQTFFISNGGNVDLTGLGINITGTNAARFTVTSDPSAPVPAGYSTSFTVTFAPTGIGAATAMLHIASSDIYNTPFDLNLAGDGVDSLVQPIDPGAPVLNSQTGLVEQSVTLTNYASSSTGGFQLRIDGVPDGVSVVGGTYVPSIPSALFLNGAHAPAAPVGGYWLVNYSSTVQSGEVIELLLQYSFTGSVENIAPVVAVQPRAIAPGAADPAFANALRGLPADPLDGSRTLSFKTVPGRVYQVESSADLQTWFPVSDAIFARGAEAEWKDDGTFTGSIPATAVQRFYRIHDVTP